ncbi:hypothetical protein IV203_034598 [Nitzschia inconspicua]|uniref:Uncharacterized protein n=1 Tax=Nitzschia inconspicua TaxID=303405 RepID=A0A9K3K811_9STRA|nr:hypothetical protein IV203_002656 [Nitzschia inconspicua]KAG7359500.1 hypothetical protein IV203_034598 [Nitzschia inconspicua]
MGITRFTNWNRSKILFPVSFMALMLMTGGNFLLYFFLDDQNGMLTTANTLHVRSWNGTQKILLHLNEPSALSFSTQVRIAMNHSATVVLDQRSTKMPSQPSYTAIKLSIQNQGNVDHTIDVLRRMGVKNSHLEDHKQDIPPWSQILDNYGGVDEVIILGQEQCEDYRKKTPLREIAIGPAGLFSTGTNLLYQLIKANCRGPDQTRYGRQRPLKFSLIQVPWGKHNPEEARGVYEVSTMNRYVENPMAVLPVVSIRHPYTWMSAMCTHGYGTRWPHRPEQCGRTLNLEGRIQKVPYGFVHNGTHPVKNTYQSLAHLYMEWYKPYFEQRNYPRLMIRFEDLVYRPKEVVTKICDCVGGTMTGWKGQFIYKTKTSNKGPGHGQRSDLLSAFIKYGQPLTHFYGQFNGPDRLIMSQAFRGERNAVEEHNILDALKYPLLG